jgi:hypothetical protein
LLDAPSALTLTANGTDSIVVTWSDNSSAETGYLIFLQPGGYNDSTSNKVLSVLGAGVECDTIGAFWPPNSKWFLDVAAYSATDTIYTVQGGDSVYLEPAIPKNPYVKVASDTSFKYSILGYNQIDMFKNALSYTDDWYTINGVWDVGIPYYRLGLDQLTGRGVIYRNYDEDIRDVEFGFTYHTNDSIRLDQQYVRFLFSTTGDTAGNGYSLWLDSSKVLFTIQTAGIPIDTVIDTTYTGSYKWRDVKVLRDWEENPLDSVATWTILVDSDTLGSDTSQTYLSLPYLVLVSSHTRHEWDNIYSRYFLPGGNYDSTYYAVVDSISGNYIDFSPTPDSLESTVNYGTFWDYDSLDGRLRVSSGDSLRLRIKAKFGDF